MKLTFYNFRREFWFSLGWASATVLRQLQKMFQFSALAAGAAHSHCWAPHQKLIQASHGNEMGTLQVLAWSLENSRLFYSIKMIYSSSLEGHQDSLGLQKGSDFQLKFS